MQTQSSQPELSLLLRRLEERQRRGLAGTVVGLLVAAAAAGVIVWLSYVTVASNLAQVTDLRRQLTQVGTDLAQAEKEKQLARAEADRARAEAIQAQQEAQQARHAAEELRATVEQIENQVRELETRLRESANFVRFIHSIEWTDAKSLASRYPEATGILLALSEPSTRAIPWRLGGRSPQEGFDSPRFAAFMLCRTGVLRDFPRFASQEALRARFQPTSEPRVGDLALFEGGYTMFFLRDRREQSFVVGMTPVGVTALEMRFARLIGFLRVTPPPSRLDRCP